MNGVGSAFDKPAFDRAGLPLDLDVPRQFIRDAFDVLVPGGRLLLVANRTLPYEAMLDESFGTHRSQHDGRRFKVLMARKS